MRDAQKALFITCVSPLRPHPSGRLAAELQHSGFEVLVLFENSRSVKSIWKDANQLATVLAESAYNRAMINVNGSLAQAVAIVLCRYHGVSTTLWIMDSYPGCLRYVTRLWWIFYLPFFAASALAKTLANKVLVIDEAFVDHFPSWKSFRKRCTYFPLPQSEAENKVLRSVEPHLKAEKVATIGVLGNIENRWLLNEFPLFYAEARKHGYRIIVATSHSVDKNLFSAEGIDCVIPWPKAETDLVFSKCAAVLVPLSSSRLIYSSPSKIIDCYLRGIQPVVMTDVRSWRLNKHRKIYGRCVHLSEFFATGRSFTAVELRDYSRHWLCNTSKRLLTNDYLE